VLCCRLCSDVFCVVLSDITTQTTTQHKRQHYTEDITTQKTTQPKRQHYTEHNPAQETPLHRRQYCTCTTLHKRLHNTKENTTLAGRSSEQLVGNLHALAIYTDMCISLNWLKSLSEFMRFCQSLSCFLSTAFTTIRFQWDFPRKSAFFV
jgi:hypothetical protein